jgi:hypothetical protein
MDAATARCATIRPRDFVPDGLRGFVEYWEVFGDMTVVALLHLPLIMMTDPIIEYFLGFPDGRMLPSRGRRSKAAALCACQVMCTRWGGDESAFDAAVPTRAIAHHMATSTKRRPRSSSPLRGLEGGG